MISTTTSTGMTMANLLPEDKKYAQQTFSDLCQEFSRMAAVRSDN